MAKQYTSIVVEGRTLKEVELCLASIVGSPFEQWRADHLLGMHIDLADVSEPVRYGMQYEPIGQPEPVYPIIEVDLYSRTDLPTRLAQAELASLIAARLSERLGVKTIVRDGDG